ncbi:MAG: glycoside hydrolase family 88/105 protein [Candidatus Helarchaeota archaeon]
MIKFNLKYFWALFTVFILTFPLIFACFTYRDVTQKNELVRVAEYTMNEMDFSFGTWGKGIMLEGLLYAYDSTNDKRYLDFVRYWTDQSIYTQTNDGVFSHGETTIGDSSAIGISVLYFYNLTNDSFYLDAAVKNMKYLLNIPPRTIDGGLSHRASNVELWIDTVYMVCPFLAKLGMILENDTLINEAVSQLLIHDKYLKDPKTSLYRHIWSQDGNYDDPNLWSRGIGWITAAISEVLYIIPNSHSNYSTLIKILQKSVHSISQYQDPSGLWHTIINDSNTQLETSCSTLFAYSIALALNNSWIEDEGNKSVAIKAFNAVINKVDPFGVVRGVSGGTGWNSYNTPIYDRAISWGQGLFLKMYNLFDKLEWIT